MRLGRLPAPPKPKAPKPVSEYKRHIYPQLIADFLKTFFENVEPDPSLPDGYASVRFEVVWRHWVWFAQTHPDTRMFFPYGMPRSQMSLGKLLHKGSNSKSFGINTALRATTFKRGDRARDSSYGDTKHTTYIIVLDKALRYKPLPWPGMENAWFPNNWLQNGSTLGNHLFGVDPRWEIVQQLKARQLLQEQNGAKRWQAAKEFETNLEKRVLALHQQRDIFDVGESLTPPPLIIPPPII